MFRYLLVALAFFVQSADLNDEQRAALDRMNAELASARAELVKVSYAEPRDEKAIRAKAESVAAAELALAEVRAKLTPTQIAGLITRRNPQQYEPGGTIPNITQAQVDALTQLTTDLMPLVRTLASARAAVDSDIHQKAQAVQQAELALAEARADAFAKIQSSANRLAPDQIQALVKMGGSFANIAFTKPSR